MRKQFQRSFLFFLFCLTLSTNYGQIVISEIISPNQAELQNLGSDTVNIDQYWLCNRPAYERIGSLSAVCGTFNLAPGAFVVVNSNQVQMPREGGELGIYRSGDFGNENEIEDYVIWGNRGGATRESVAIRAGIWTMNDRAPEYSESEALLYDGEGDAASDFYLGTSTPCEQNERCEVSGGSLTFSAGGDIMMVCVDDGIADSVMVSLDSAIGSNMIWVVTDTNGIIIDLPDTLPMSFEGSGSGVCLIRNLSFEDTLSGLSIDSSVSNIMGCFSLSDSVTINKVSGDDCPAPPCDVDGGMIALADSLTEVTICLDDSLNTGIEVSLTGSRGTNSAWVVTDTDLTILRIDTTNQVDFTSSGAGVCLVWHVSFEDLEGVVVDSNAANLSGCFDLSNSITVNKVEGDDCLSDICEVDGGSVMTRDSLTEVTICIDDENEDLVIARLSGSTGAQDAWVITDSDMIILAIDTNTSVFNLEFRGEGVCFIWNLSYESGLAGLGISIHKDSLQGCFDYSNPITINKVSGDDCPAPPCEVDGGMIVLADSLTEVTICLDDSLNTGIEVNLTGAMGTNSAWVVTDTDLTILRIDTTNQLDFTSAGAGVCLVWHVSFEDLEGVVVDSNAANLSGCFDLSNSITVNKVTGDDCPAPPCEVLGGTIMTTDSLTEVIICVDDTLTEVIEVVVDQATGMNEAWVVTNADLIILQVDTSNSFNLDNSAPGECLIWHVGYDSIQGLEVDSSAVNLTGCFALSNSISVTKLSGFDCPNTLCEVQGGNLSTAEGMTEVVICGGTSSSDPIEVQLDSAVGSRSAWIIADSSGTILGFPLAPPFNLSGASPGTFNIWHLTYEGSIQGASLGLSINDLSGCFALSNPIIVRRVDVMAVTISFPDGAESIDICIGSDNAGELQVMIDGGEGTSISWVLTDEDGVILEISESPTFDFDHSSVSNCRIRAVSKGGDVTGLEIAEDIENLSGCFALSNSLGINKTQVNGGSIATEIGSTSITVCAGDENDEDINLIVDGAVGPNMSFIITDTNNVIIQVLDDLENIRFDSTQAGSCLIYHVSYADSLEGLEEGSSLSDLVDCFHISNAVSLTKVSGEDCPPPCNVMGGVVSTLSGDDEITICVNDGISDAFDLEVEGASGDNRAFIVIDEDGNILGLEPIFMADFEGTNEGRLFVRHISYDDEAEIPEIGGNINMLDGCYDLSNVLTINRVEGDDCPGVCNAEGGNLTSDLGDEVSLCVDDDDEDNVNVMVDGNAGENNVFVLTDAVFQILSIQDDGNFDFSGSGSGTCLISHLSYTGSLSGLQVGANMDGIEGCFNFSNSITVIKLTASECPESCTTDGGSVMTIEGETELEFCNGEVFFSVTHMTENEDSTALYYYVLTDNEGNVLSWRNSEEGMDYDLSAAPPGICRLYGYNSSDLSLLEEGVNVEDLVSGCSRLSENFISINKQEGGACDSGCHRPRDIRVQQQGRNRFIVRWDRVQEADGYLVRIGFEGVPGSFSEVPINRNRIILSGPSNRVLVIQIASVCGRNEVSDFTREIRLVAQGVGASAIGRSPIRQHGTVLPSGIIISEQALAYPNPANDRVTIWYEGEGVDGKLTIFDRLGRRVLVANLPAQNELHELSINTLENGMYFLIVESEGIILMEDKLVKTNRL